MALVRANSCVRIASRKAWCATLLVASAAFSFHASPAAANQGITAVWQGRYFCRQGWTGLDLIIHADAEGRLAARFKSYALPENPAISTGEFNMVGRLDGRGDRFRLYPTNWIVQPPGYTTVSLQGKLEASGQSIAGRILSQGCGDFSLVRTNAKVPDAVAALPHGQGTASPGYGPAPAAQPPSLQPAQRPELSEKAVQVSSGQQFEYTDAVILKKPGREIGVEPIDQLNQWLLEKNFKCLSTFTVSAGGAYGPGPFKTSSRHFGKKWYVFHCSGDCAGLRYSLDTYGVLWHLGLSQPYPVVYVTSTSFGYGEIRFSFQHSGAKGTATVTVSEWSGDPGDYGGGCAATMFKAPR